MYLDHIRYKMIVQFSSGSGPPRSTWGQAGRRGGWAGGMCNCNCRGRQVRANTVTIAADDQPAAAWAIAALDLPGVAGVCVHDRVLTVAHQKDGVIQAFE